MGVKMNTGRVKTQLSQMNTQLMGVQAKACNLKIQFSAFCEEDKLTIVAYQSQKDYIQNMQSPTADGIGGFCTAMIKANNQYSEAVSQYFPEGMEIDEDKWRAEYEKVVDEYNKSNSYLSWVIEVISGLLPLSRQGHSLSVRNPLEEQYLLIRYTLEEKLEQLKKIMDWYRGYIENVGQMLSATANIYSDAESVQGVTGAAIVQLGNVSVGTNGVYNTCLINREPFQAIYKQQLEMEIAEQIEIELGDELLSQKEFESLESDKQIEYINKLATVVSKWVPKVSTQVGSATLEGPVGPGLTLYAGTTASVGVVQTESQAAINLAAKENERVLSTWGVTVGGTTAKVNVNGPSIRHTYKANNVTDAYIEVSYSDKEDTVKGEWGSVTKVDGGTVTTKFGVKAKDTNDWQDVDIVQYELSGVDDIRIKGGVFDFKGVPILLPNPVPVPAF